MHIKEGSQQTAHFHERGGSGGQGASQGKKPLRFAAPKPKKDLHWQGWETREVAKWIR